jgi:hypothetical protein
MARNSILILLVIALGLALCTQLGLHPLVNPAHHADQVSSLFTEDGHCKAGEGGARLQASEENKFMYLCFVDMSKIALWVTINKMGENCISRDCTRFFTDPAYVRNAIARWGYQLIDQSGAPQWFINLFSTGG